MLVLQNETRYNWSAYEQSIILGAYFYGYAISSIPLGILVDKFGYSSATIFWGFVLAILMTLAVPLSADYYVLLVFLRFGVGFFSVSFIVYY